VVTGALGWVLVFAPAAWAGARGEVVALGFLGLPSLHSIIEGIAKGFFSALAGALVPGFLKHGSVATIQHLVALPDPASWVHVSELQSDMTYLGVSLMPVTVAVCTLRYWMMGLTGAAHPVTALARCAWATGTLVIYRWLVEQTVAATNTLTHAILAFPVVANGLASIISVLFGGALLAGAGGVFGAFLVIVGVIFAAGLFACAEALTVLLALVFCAGPPLIALAPIPELSHLARVWGHALMAIVLVPVGWTILFASAGALTLDATSFSGASGLPGHIAAAFAGLITFVIAVKLPLMCFGQLRHILASATHSTGTSQGQRTMPGVQRVRGAHARLRTVAMEGVPSLGRSAGRAAGAIGAPEGGPLGTVRRGLASATGRSGLTQAAGPGRALGAIAGAARTAGATGGVSAGRGGVRTRLARAVTILASAPRDARAAMAASSRRPTRAPNPTGTRTGRARAGAATPTGNITARVATATAPATGARTVTVKTGGRASAGARPVPPTVVRAQPQLSPSRPAAAARGAGEGAAHPGRKVTDGAQREASTPAPSQPRPAQPASSSPKRPPAGSRPPATPPAKRPRRRSGK
jgi:hypothetical protein